MLKSYMYLDIIIFNSRKKWVKHKLKIFSQIYICFVKSIQKTNHFANVKQKSMWVILLKSGQNCDIECKNSKCEFFNVII